MQKRSNMASYGHIFEQRRIFQQQQLNSLGGEFLAEEAEQKRANDVQLFIRYAPGSIYEIAALKIQKFLRAAHFRELLENKVSA